MNQDSVDFISDFVDDIVDGVDENDSLYVLEDELDENGDPLEINFDR